MSSESAGTSTLTLPTDALEENLTALPDDAISEEAEAWAREICEALCRHHFASGRSPNGLAAAAIYSAALVKDGSAYGGRVGLSQERVSELCDASMVTIRNNYKNVIAAWAEVNEDDLDREELRTYRDVWEADVDVPEPEWSR